MRLPCALTLVATVLAVIGTLGLTLLARMHDVATLQLEAQGLQRRVLALEAELHACKQARDVAEREKNAELQVAQQQRQLALRVNKPLDPFIPKLARDVITTEGFDTALYYSPFMKYKVTKLLGQGHDEITQVIEHARTRLQAQDKQAWDVSYGSMKLDRLRGIQYVVDFRRAPKQSGEKMQFRRVSFLRPFEPSFVDEPCMDFGNYVERLREHLYVVMPLVGRVEMLRSFLDMFGPVVAELEGKTTLVIVYFVDGSEKSKQDLEAARAMLSESALKHGFGMQLTTENGPFSRGKGLNKGVELTVTTAKEQGISDPLLFFCDVDMQIQNDFWYRCRATPETGKRVFFPVPFSLYRNGKPRVGHEHGEWRIFGMGMACLFHSDFQRAGGFDTSIKGWGEEDVALYQRFVSMGEQGMDVFRAIDKGIIHLWHEKVCSPSLAPAQLEHCKLSMMDYEGSKKQLGMMVVNLQEELEKVRKSAHAA